MAVRVVDHRTKYKVVENPKEWRARAHINGRQISLGFYHTKIDAVIAENAYTWEHCTNNEKCKHTVCMSRTGRYNPRLVRG